jgi:PAS domain S-box-containing protein
MVKSVAEPLPKGSIAPTEEELIYVLYVDDETGLLKAAKTILEMQGAFHVETVSSVEEALKRMGEKTFDVIISDYIMPRKDGLEFLRELRESGNNIPFILFTGKGREIVAIKALNLGADQYVNKIGYPEAVYSELSHGIRTVVKGKKAEEALKDIEKEKSAVLDSMSELVIHQDLKHRILWTNSKAAESVNIKVEQVKGRYCHELWGGSAKPCIGCPIEEAIKTGQPQQGEITTPDGRVWFINGSPIKDAKGKITSIVEVVTNITEQKSAEEEVRKSEARYRGLVENIGNGIATTELEGRITFVNQALCEMIGYSEKELIGKPFADFLHPDDKKRMLQLFSDSGKDPNRKLSVEFRVLHKKGHIIHMCSSPNATIHNNKIVGFNAILSDVTEHKKAEEALQEAEEKYRRVVEQAPDSIMIFDLNGVVTSCNDASVAMSGHSKDEFIGKHFSELKSLSEGDIQKFLKLLDSLLEGKAPEPFEIAYINEDGTSAFGEVHISSMKEGERVTGFQAIMRDITEHKKAEEKLRESEEKFRNLAEKSPNMIFINKRGRVVYANKRCEEIMGYTKEEFYSPEFNFFTLIAPESMELLKSSYSNHLNGDEIHPYEYTIITKEGKRIDAILTSKLINYERETAILGIITDITERKQIEKQLKESEEKYRKQFEESLDAIFLGDAKTGEIVDCNPAATKLVGRKKSELIGKHQRILHPPESVEGEFSTTFEQHRTEKESQALEDQIITKDGKIRDVMINSTIFEVEGRKLLQGTFHDITERKKVEAELRREKELMEWVTANNAAALVIISEDFRILWANRLLTEFLGDIKGKVCYSTLNNLTDVCPGCGVKQILETGKNKVVHEQVVSGVNGQKVWLEITAIPIRDKKGNLIAVSEMAIDVTDRKKAKEALMRSEKRFRELSELLPEVIFETDFNGVLTFVNKAAFERFGYSHEEFKTGLHVLQMVVPEERKRAKENIEWVLRGEKLGPNEYMGMRKDGTTFPFIITSTPVIHENKLVGIRGIIVDITERKKAEEALRSSEKKYRELLNGMNDTAWVIDFDCNIIDVNDAAVEVMGYSREELLFMGLTDIDSNLNPEEIKDLVEGMPADEIQVFETVHTTKTGKKIPVEISSSLVTYRGKRAILSIARDITERKRAEEKLEQMMDNLVAINEKLGVIGKLTRHDVRNKLAVIANNAYLARQTLASNPDALEYLGDIESAIDQMEEIFDFARNYEMLGVEDLSYIDVEKNVDEAAVLFSEFANVKLVNECQNLTVMADSLLRQVFYNLIDNTLKYGEKVSQIRVYCQEEENQLKLVYEDDGVGIQETEKEKIFKEGYGKGTGYGLYLIRKICENYGWTIQETGVPGKGAQFTMTIPRISRSGKMGYIITYVW